MSEVRTRDWRLFRKNLISRYGDGSGKDPWDDGCWAHDIGTVEAVRRLFMPPYGTWQHLVLLRQSRYRVWRRE